jgi:hypothetical protein
MCCFGEFFWFAPGSRLTSFICTPVSCLLHTLLDIPPPYSMPPRRSRANGASEEGASTSSALQVELESDRLAQGLASWDTDGRQIVKDILVGQTSQDLVTASTIPLSNTLIGLLQSKATPDEVTEVLSGLAESLEEERKESLWEALVDAITVLVDDRDDCTDLVKQEGMDVDGQATDAPGAKGIKIVKSLLVSHIRLV